MSTFRWFADESVLGLGRLLARRRDDVLYPGHPALPEVPLGALDVDWMPVVAQRGRVPVSGNTWEPEVGAVPRSRAEVVGNRLQAASGRQRLRPAAWPHW